MLNFETERKAEDLVKAAKLYLEGDVSTRNHERGMALLNEALKKGSTEAAIMLGMLYKDGEGCPFDMHKAYELFALAPDSPFAQIQQGLILANDRSFDLNMIKAFKHFATFSKLNDGYC